MGVLPVALHSNYSAGMLPVPVMKWVLQWVDLKLSGHYILYSRYWVQRDEWRRTAAALDAPDGARVGPAEQTAEPKPTI